MVAYEIPVRIGGASSIGWTIVTFDLDFSAVFYSSNEFRMISRVFIKRNFDNICVLVTDHV